tara:strand:- start:1409 stop:2995 length:1587 start_codon:yes stop_codon:yes gene_type:complete
MDTIPETFNNYFTRLYNKKTYLDKYGGSVVATAVSLLIFFCIFSFFYVQSKMDPIRQNWANERCKPEVMPFAGLINAPKGTSKMAYTAENFTKCTVGILSEIVQYFTYPLYYTSDLVSSFYLMLMKVVQAFRTLAFYLRMQVMKMIEYIVARIYNVMIPVQRMFIKLKDTLKKTEGIMVTGLYTVFSAYLAVKAFVGSFLQLLIIALIILVAVIIALWILPFTWPAAAALTVFFVLISIPVAIIAGWMVHILNIQSRSVPKKPGCFDKNTKIATKDGLISICNIKLGTILENEDRVTATFKIANSNDMYKFNNIVVSGSHKVLHDLKGWIFIKDHPDSIKIENYYEPYIYCISTETKRINIGNYKFLDWDDIEPIDVIKLKNLDYLHTYSPLSDIHRYLESGIDGNSLIELEDGNDIKLKNIQINDVLRGGERVIAKVEIDTKNISYIRKYKFGDFEIIGAPNIHICDTDLGNFNTLDKFGKVLTDKEKLYHLITDTGFFMVNGFKIRDYNSAIENILDVRDKLYALS